MPQTRRARARRRPTRGPADLSSLLERIASEVEASCEANGCDSGNELISVRLPAGRGPGDDAAEVGLAPIDGDLGDVLAGFRAPDAWDAIGVASHGWYRAVDDSGALGSRLGRVRNVHLQHRRGARASVLRRAGDDAIVVPGPVEGRIADLLRRAMSLRTAPPASGPLELFALHWLGALLGAAPASLATWDAVASRHPLLGLAEDASDDERAAAAADLPSLVDLAARTLGWERARQQCASGEVTIAGVEPSLADWLDEGSFARWVLGAFPPVDELADAVAVVLPDALAAQLRATLCEWGLGGMGLRV